MNSNNKLIVFSDGAARGNPGPAGAGGLVRARKNQEILAKTCEYLGEKTNNVAEYMALLLTLNQARQWPTAELEIFADSELMVRQLNGVYRVKDATLKLLYQRVNLILQDFPRTSITYVPREKNKEADALANEAIEAYLRGKKREIDITDLGGPMSLL
ncbi:MAG TPA: ribonuclease HI family protein [Actinobacteria bacterium]|nr:ribonuclease HI family protein [Actinomycetes bacterium]HEX21041.1 ribonuclease HI family protein [Actinomycetota bacterium]